MKLKMGMDMDIQTPNAKLKTRVVGGRRLVMRDDETKLGTQDEWFLYRIEGWSRHGWDSLKLYRYVKGPKNLWQLGVSLKDKRYARNKDLKLLTEHYPQIAEWVLATALKAREI